MKFAQVLVFFAVCLPFSSGWAWSYVYLKYFKQKAVEIIDHAIPKDDCSRHLKAWVGDLFNWKKIWALRMLDASAKLQTGFLSGNIFHFGNYDECLNIYEEKEEIGPIVGQYCTVALTPAQNTSSDLGQILDFTTSIPEIMGIQEGKDMKHILRLVKMIYGICLPKSCNADSIQKLWNHVEYSFRLPIHVSVGDEFCLHKGKVPHVFEFDNIAFWIFGLYFSFLCFASIYDMMFADDNSEGSIWDNILTAFSLRKNGLKILDTRPSENEDSTFSCISGLKAISMLWVIYGHKYAINFFSGTVNMLEYFEFRKSLPALFILVAPFSVDTFLVVSGLLVSYKYMQIRNVLPRNKPFPYLMFYFMRLLRLWPCLIATILVYGNILKYLNDGPLWPLVTYKMALSCKYTGLATAFFATNFVKFHYQCLEPTWYLAVDTQLYVLAPFILYLLYKYPKRTTMAFIAASALSAIYAYYVTITTYERWTPSEGDNSFHNRIYQSPFVRMPVWLFGLLTGTLLYHYQQMRIPQVVVTIMWTLIAALLIGVLAANHILTVQPYNEFHSALFNAAARPAWGVAICLLIILCATGHGGRLNDILSLNIYKPLTKVSYSVYLIHSVVIMVFQGSKKSPTFHNSFKTFHGYLGDLPFIMIMSFFWCLAFESPFINLAKMIIKQGKKDFNNKIAIASDDKKRLKKAVVEHKESSRNKYSKLKKMKNC